MGRWPPGTRVSVFSGDQTQALGMGTYVGDVDVYFIVMPDGSLKSERNPEQPPDPKFIPRGGRVTSAKANPKIKLDTGEIVYGCQVWWDPVDRNVAG